MSDQKTINPNNKDASINHLCYLGGVLAESIKNFRRELLAGLDRPASVIMSSPSFLRIMELTESLEQAIRLCFTFP